ncbi:MAG: ATP synthase F0 subunit B [Bdellovibrionales bacterium]|nr:ATP synthase F0 subunit B [Bdellovibrionales bacterium]
MNKMILLLNLLLSFSAAWASSGGHGGGEHEIPWAALYPQFLNFTAVIVLIVIFGRKKIAAHFHGRKAMYADLVTRSQLAKNQAEDHKQKIVERLTKLDQTTSDSIQRAKAEASDIKRNIIRDAQEIAKRLETDAARFSQFELERARTELRNEMISQAFDGAVSILSTDVNAGKHKMLHSEFAAKIKVVGQ